MENVMNCPDCGMPILEHENRIECEWNGFMKAAFRRDIALPPNQLRELRRTFFAGVAGALSICSERVPEGTDVDAWLTERVMQLRAELHQFNEDVKAGRA